jgi:DNA repair protein RecO (recombination protein O)
MAAIHQSEAILLRTWPFAEADLLVSLFTREQGVVRGVARHAMRSRRRFGGALEPMTEVRATWREKPKQDLVGLDQLEILWSPLREPVDLARATGLALVAEVLESALPDRAPEDDVYRLALAVAKRMRGDNVFLPATYFLLWINRLLGWMPDLSRCSATGASLRGQTAYFSPVRDGLFAAQARPQGSLPLSAESLRLAEDMFRNPITAFEGQAWPRGRAADLRRFAGAMLERHLEERLQSLRMLAKL